MKIHLETENCKKSNQMLQSKTVSKIKPTDGIRVRSHQEDLIEVIFGIPIPVKLAAIERIVEVFDQEGLKITLMAWLETKPKKDNIVLVPRTKPIEGVAAKESGPSAAIIGNAKVVDSL